MVSRTIRGWTIPSTTAVSVIHLKLSGTRCGCTTDSPLVSVISRIYWPIAELLFPTKPSACGVSDSDRFTPSDCARNPMDSVIIGILSSFRHARIEIVLVILTTFFQNLLPGRLHKNPRRRHTRLCSLLHFLQGVQGQTSLS